MSKQRKIIIIFLVLIILGCLGYIGYYVYDTYIVPKQEDKKNDELRKEYKVVQLDDKDYDPTPKFEYDEYGDLVKKEPQAPKAAAIPPQDDESVDNRTSLEKIQEKNKNVLAWIKVDDTTIDYPVVQGKDNEYYLQRDINGYYSVNGSIFLDKSVELGKSQNIVIYGHYMNADCMFHSLDKFKLAEFGRSHDVYFDMGDGYNPAYEVVAVFTCSSFDAVKYTQPDFDKTSVSDYIKEIKGKRTYDTGKEMEEFDQYLTLVTCSYDHQNYRTVVVCRRK